jgi:2-polyprenyl-6-methoxyphenol hydroxylase-like FAD-dependent oxidoreductase
LIYDSTKDRAKYVFGTSVKSFEEKDGGVEVRFEDGKTDRFDLLVGADGQGSRTHKRMLGLTAADAVHPLGICVAYFTIPQQIQEGGGVHRHAIHGSRKAGCDDSKTQPARNIGLRRL